MNTEGFINVCQAVKHGHPHQVTNFKTNKQGVVVSWRENLLTVQVDQATEIWPYEDCEELDSATTLS